MKSNSTLWAVIILVAILSITGVGIYAIYVKKTSKAGYVNESALFNLIGKDFSWFNDTFASDMVANGRNDKVANAMYDYNPDSSSTSDINPFGLTQ